jgi:hypothetical protein
VRVSIQRERPRSRDQGILTHEEASPLATIKVSTPSQEKSEESIMNRAAFCSR